MIGFSRQLKRVFFIALIVLAGALCVSGAAGAAEEAAVPAEEAAAADKVKQVLPDVEAVMKDKKQVEREVQEVAREKDALSREKEDLEKSVSRMAGETGKGAAEPETTEVMVIQEKLKTVEKKKDAAETRELALKKKIDAYEKITRFVERKLRMLASEKLTFQEVQSEIKYVRGEIAQLAAEKTVLQRKAAGLEREVRTIEQDLSAKRFLAEVREENAQAHRERIRLSEERLEAMRKEIAFLREIVALVVLQREIEDDYLDALIQVRQDSIRESLWIAKPFGFKLREFMLLVVLAVIFVAGLLLRRRLEGLLAKHGTPLAGGLLIQLVRAFLFGGCAFIPAYFFAGRAGYQALAFLVGVTLLCAFGFMVFFGIAHQVLNVLFRRLFARERGLSLKELVRQYPGVNILSTVSGWLFFFLAVYSVLCFWGLEREGFDFAKKAAQHPFFSLGSVNLSAWLLFKMGFVVWLFVLSSSALDNLLRRSIYPRTQLDATVKYAFSAGLKYLILFAGCLTALRVLGVDMGALTVFAGTLGIGIGLGLQEIAKNFISGLILLVERPIKIGDFIEIGGLPGKVCAIKARGTVVETFDNISVVVPNSEFVTQRIVNWSYSDRVIRMVINVGVAYGSDTQLVKKSLLEAAEKNTRVLTHPAPMVWFEAFGESSLNFKLLAWTNETDNRKTIMSEIHFDIDRIFRERKITIPFPQRDLHLRTSEAALRVDKAA